MSIVVLSVGGSKIVPNEIDLSFLRALRLFVRSSKHRFIIVCGGGKTCRTYQEAARNFTSNENALDWIGIRATQVNAELVRGVFGDLAHKVMLIDPTKKVVWKEKVLVAAGWKPGWTTDLDAVLWAVNQKSKTVVNLTNVSHVFTADPTRNPNAKPIMNLSWDELLQIIGKKHKPGMHVPFDPVAAVLAKKKGITCLVINSISELKKYLANRSFEGSVIHP